MRRKLHEHKLLLSLATFPRQEQLAVVLSWRGREELDGLASVCAVNFVWVQVGEFVFQVGGVVICDVD